MKGISTLPVIAHVKVKVKDPEVAKRLKARIDSSLKRHFVPELDVRLQEFMNKGESISTQLQMGWVSCFLVQTIPPCIAILRKQRQSQRRRKLNQGQGFHDMRTYNQCCARGPLH